MPIQRIAVIGATGMLGRPVTRVLLDAGFELTVVARTPEKASLSIARVPLGLVKLVGRFSRRADYAARIVEAINHYPETFQAQATWEELGEPTTTLADFARRVSAGDGALER